jgi:protein associated with RNAse G/E
VLSTDSAIRVRKLRPDGTEVFAWEGVVLRCDDSGIVLRALFNVDQVELGFTTFRRGDVFVEFYYWDRWFNVFQVSQPDGTLKGWYANLGKPAELEAALGELRYVDLELDVWSDPGGALTILDEVEFTELLAARPDLAAGAEQGRVDLFALATTGQLPRWPEPNRCDEAR